MLVSFLSILVEKWNMTWLGFESSLIRDFLVSSVRTDKYFLFRKCIFAVWFKFDPSCGMMSRIHGKEKEVFLFNLLEFFRNSTGIQ